MSPTRAGRHSLNIVRFQDGFRGHTLSSVQWVRDRLFIRLFILNRLETGTIVFGTRQWLDDVLYRHRCAKRYSVTNAVVTWNTVYMEAALAQLRTEGVLAGDLDLSHLSPALYGHLNPSPSDDP